METNTDQARAKTIKAFGRAVIIGLGGTGQKALLQIKKNFQDTCDGKVPDCVKLLSFDTDQQEAPLRDVKGREVKFTENEFCRIGVSLVREAIKNPYVQDWWISFPNLDSTAITDGAGGIREAGRLALFSCIDQVCGRITTAYNGMKAFGIKDKMATEGFQMMEGSPQVVVIGSLAGGTGGGLFFDMSILCRNLGGADFKYMAYILMPWVYRDQANTAYENTFAGLVELDRLARLDVAPSPLRIRYAEDREFTLNECPYHIVNLVDGQCENGERITRADEIVAFIAESVYHLTGALGAPARSIYDNIIALKNGLSPDDWKGCRAIFSTIGVSTIRYPAPEMHRAIVCQRTSELLDSIAKEIAAAAPAGRPAGQAAAGLDAILDQYKLRPNREGIIGQLLQPASGKPLALDNDDFESLANRADVVSLIAQQVKQSREKADMAFKRVQDQLRESIWSGVRALLDAKPKAEQAGMAEAMRATLDGFRTSLSEQCRTADSEAGITKERVEQAEGRIPEENNLLARMTGRFRSQARQHVYAINDSLQAELSAAALREAMELLGALVKNLDEFLRKQGSAKTEAERLAESFRALARSLAAESTTYIPRKGSGKKRFEYILGVDDGAVSDDPYYWFFTTNPVPTAADLRKMIEGLADVGPAAAAAMPPKEYVQRLQDFVAEKCASVLSHSAVAVIAQNKKDAEKQGKEDPTPALMKRAQERSTLLLPIRADLNELARKGTVKDFMIVGVGRPATEGVSVAKQIEEDQNFIEKALPQCDKNNIKMTNTADPYRITLTRYKAIFPLYAVNGIDELRRAYNERVMPPTHIDRKDLFNLEDPLPEDDTHHLALKLLTLALMECFGVIRHVHKEEGGSYFLPVESLWPECLDNYDIEQKLPGKPGKFYSLVEELARDHFKNLRGKIREELARTAAPQAFLSKFLDEAKARQADFQSRVEDVAAGLNKNAMMVSGKGRKRSWYQFNKMVTGRYYRREADFFSQVLRRQDAIRKQVASGKNLVDILFDRNEDFTI